MAKINSTNGKVQSLTDTDEKKVQILNTIRDGIDPSSGAPYTDDTYKNMVPIATLANIQDVGNPIINYAPVQNQFLNVFINKIAFSFIQAKSFRNPLKVLKKGGVPLGYDIEEIYTNPATADEYTLCGVGYSGDTGDATDGLFDCAKPDTKVAYHRMNRQDKYKVRIARPALQRAFTNWQNFGQFVDSVINSLYNGDEIDEFDLTKKMIGDAVSNNRIVTVPVGPVNDETSARNFARTLRLYVENMQLPSNAYNAWAALNPTDTPVKTWVESANDLILIIRNDITSYLDVEVLSAAFNISRVEYLGVRLGVDNFGPNAPNVYAVLADKAWTQIYDNLKEMREWSSPSGLYNDYWLHHWQTYSYSPMANAVAFTSDAPSPDSLVTDIRVSDVTITPAFDPATDTYTGTTTANTGVISVSTQFAPLITFNGTPVSNGETVTFTTGTNSLIVMVSDGTNSATYTINITKS